MRTSQSLHSLGGSELYDDLTTKPSWMYSPGGSGLTFVNSSASYSHSSPPPFSPSSSAVRRQENVRIYNQSLARIEHVSTGSSSRLSRRPFARTTGSASKLSNAGYSVMYGGNHHITKHPPPSAVPTGASTFGSRSIVSMTSDGPRIDYAQDRFGIRNATSGVINAPAIQPELPDEWVAVTSKLNSMTFFYNTRTKETRWNRPFRAAYPASPPPSPPPPPICNHDRCKSYGFCCEIGPHLPTDEDLNIRNMEHDLVSIDFATALMRFGPRVLLYKILMASVVHCFETWHDNAIQSRVDREKLHFLMATKIQSQYRRVLVEKEMIERVREYKKRLKCADFPDIRTEMKALIENMSDETRSWFVPFTGKYLDRVIGASKKKAKPKNCQTESCIQPPYLTQKNGLCVQCNYFIRFPNKAALARVMANM